MCRTNEGGQAGKNMTSPRVSKNRLVKNSIATAALAAAFVVTPILAQAQDSAPPPPDQYGNQNPYQGQSAPPDDGMQYDAAVQNGAPQGVQQPPPEIPDYQQPPAPGDGYIWTPGYWAWTGYGYEWVQGAWVLAPYTGALWTPGYWGYGYNGYFWNTGYWGPYVGYYGGINYGFGYFGIGFYGGYWGGGRFWYNRAYCNIGHGGYGFHNVYNRPYNGYSGHPGGTSYVHSTSVGYRGGNGTAYRGSSINGRASNFTQSTGRAPYNGAIHNDSRSFNNGAGGNNAGRNFSQPAQGYSGATRNYTAPAGTGGNYTAPAGSIRSFPQQSQSFNGGARTYAAPSQAYSGGSRSFSAPSPSYGGGARSFSAPTGGSYAAPSGAGFHGGGMSGGGGGGGFHGGGGGGGGSHGGGGGHR
jgi:hypothetical protein